MKHFRPDYPEWNNPITYIAQSSFGTHAWIIISLMIFTWMAIYHHAPTYPDLSADPLVTFFLQVLKPLTIIVVPFVWIGFISVLKPLANQKPHRTVEVVCFWILLDVILISITRLVLYFIDGWLLIIPPMLYSEIAWSLGTLTYVVGAYLYRRRYPPYRQFPERKTL